MQELLTTVAGASRRPFSIARMVRPLADRGVGMPASFLRQSVVLDRAEPHAVLSISALGLYRCFINGRRVGRDVLTPGWTCYDRRLSFQTYPVGDLLEIGQNHVEIWLGDGWYRSQLMWAACAMTEVWGDKVAAIAELRAGDGAPLLATDAHWTSGELPILSAGLYAGEVYDARRETLADTAGCAEVAFDASVLVAHEAEPVRELADLPVHAQWNLPDGATVYDFGQNSAGYVALTVRGEAGAEIVVDHAEVLDGARDLDNANFRSAAARIVYILKGEGEESYRPTFSFQGFRYARVAVSGRAAVLSIVSVPISSVGTPTASFVTGHPLINRLVTNTLWSQRSNFIEIPTDCPQRDERLGWTGDAQVFAPTACYLHDCQAFFTKWLRDVVADQRPDGAIAHVVPDPTRMRPGVLPNFVGSTGWGDAICVIPWTLWTHYGDRAVLADMLPAMVRWVDYVFSISEGPIVRPPRAMTERGFTFGDWLQPKGSSEKPLPTIGDDAAATFYLFISATLAAKAAAVLGDGDIEQRMAALAARVKAAFAEEFIAPSGRLVYDDQTSYALAILHDLVPADLLPRTIEYFKASVARSGGRIGTGFIGTPALLPALVKAGEAGLAARLLLQQDVPGWLYQVRMGATTIWERWDAVGPDGKPFDPAMNSYNHYAYGAVCQWLFESVAGFRPDPEKPAFAHVLLEPVIIPELSPLSAHHDTGFGPIGVTWRVEEDRVHYAVDLPPGTTATLILAASYRDIAVDAAPAPARNADERLRLPLSAGRHEATFRLAPTGRA